jgi:hypothetical protein
MLECERRLTRVDQIAETLVPGPIGLAANLDMPGARIPLEGDRDPVGFSLVEFAEHGCGFDCGLTPHDGVRRATHS